MLHGCQQNVWRGVFGTSVLIKATEFLPDLSHTNPKKLIKYHPLQLRRSGDGRGERLPDSQRSLRPLAERHQREDVPGKDHTLPL